MGARPTFHVGNVEPYRGELVPPVRHAHVNVAAGPVERDRLDVLFAVLFAWLLLDQLPAGIQIAGGALIIGGVCLVRIDELRRSRRAVTAVVHAG